MAIKSSLAVNPKGDYMKFIICFVIQKGAFVNPRAQFVKNTK